MSWVLHRIDDRLIHGQVLVAWGARHDPARIWIADDAVAANDWERQLYLDAAPGIEVRIVGVTEAAAAHAAEAEAPGAAFLLVRDLRAARRLVEAGARVAAFNLGGLHYATGKSRLNDFVYLDDADREDARALLRLGVALEAQDVPASRARALIELEPELAR